MRKLLIALSAAVLFSAPVVAKDIELVKKVDVLANDFDGKVEIQGIRPGMSAADAWEIFSKAYPSDAPQVQKLGISIQTREVSTQNIEVAYDSQPGVNEDGLQIFMASPSVGGGVFAVRRDLYYPAEKGRPQLAAVLAQLEQKYGKPAKTKTSQWDHSTGLVWYFGGNGSCREGDICNQVLKPYVSDAYDPTKFDQYVKEMSYGPDVVIAAYVSDTPDKDGKAFSLQMSFIDLKRRGLSAQSDTEQVMSAQKALTQNPAALPEL